MIIFSTALMAVPAEKTNADETDVMTLLTPQGQWPLVAKGSGDVAQLQSKGWSLLAGEVALPLATLDWQRLEQNLAWMARFAVDSGALLAPHGKTSMSPALFQAQLASGAWALTLATVPQCSVAIAAGARRIMLANPLVGRFEQLQVKAWLAAGIEFYCLVDDIAQLPVLAAAFADVALPAPLNLWLELGVAGGRAGVRSKQAAVELAQALRVYPQLRLCGVHFYEGVAKGGTAAVCSFIADCVDTATLLQQAGLLQRAPSLDKPVLSGAGSALYDLVVRETRAASAFQLVLRPGCYALHDSGIYQQAQQQVLSRSTQACLIPGALFDALTVWAYVLSRPEPELAVVGLGKRDVAFDAGLPQLEQQYRDGQRLAIAAADFTSIKIMDQHLLLQVPATADLRVGDMLAFRTSHPCLTLDKWRQLAVLDADFYIRRLISTEF